MKKDELVLYAFRHCLHARSHIVGDMINYLRRKWLKISPTFREIIKNDILEAMHRDSMHKGATFGLELDKDAWLSFLRFVKDIEENI